MTDIFFVVVFLGFGATVFTHDEIECLPYVGFFLNLHSCFKACGELSHDVNDLPDRAIVRLLGRHNAAKEAQSLNIIYISVFEITGKSHYLGQKRTQRLRCTIL